MKLGSLKVWRNRLPQCWIAVQVVLVVGWTMLLWGVDQRLYSQVYNLCGAVSLLCMWKNRGRAVERKHSRHDLVLIATVTLAFSGAVCLANYWIFEPVRSLRSLVKFIFCLLGGSVVFGRIFLWAHVNTPIAAFCGERKKPTRFFFLCFFLASAVYLSYLAFVAYPGYYTLDTIKAFSDIVSGTYSRRFPVYHTLFIKLCLSIGYFFGGTGNSALVVYTIVQAVAMAAVCAYVLVTLYEVGSPKWCIWASFLVYTIFPYNIVYCVTIWKDIPFGIGALAMTVALFRIVKEIGSMKGNYAAFCIGSFAFCLSRTNGWYSFLGTMLLVALVLGRQHKKVLVTGAAVIVVTWAMLNPVLGLISTGESDYVELMSIPFQQIARVVHSDYDLAEEDVQLLEQVFDLEMMADLYNPGNVDKIKYECFDRTKYDFFIENLGDYIALWGRLGRRYPADYLKAWVDQTKGYWNGGYDYWIYAMDGEYAPLGFTKLERNNMVAGFYDSLFRWLQESVAYHKIACSIGLNVWIMIGCMVINVLKKRKEYLIGVPALVILVGLWMCTPIYAEFRYAWPVFLIVPFMLWVTFFQQNTNEPGLSE